MSEPNQSLTRVRQNVFSITVRQLNDFVAAVQQLKKTGVYDKYVQRHLDAMEHTVHGSPWFLPWHRQFLLDFENDLRNASPGYPYLTIPYWDWAGDPANPVGTGSLLWTHDYLGGDGGQPSGADQAGDVTTGPFAAGTWTLTVMGDEGQHNPPAGNHNLRRGMGRYDRHNRQVRTLPTPADVQDVLGRPEYDSSPWNMDSTYATSFRNALEGFAVPDKAPPIGMHNRVHCWIGGSMVPMSSPNDPAFFLHHCNIDRIWAEWQDSHPGQRYVPQITPPDELRKPGDDKPPRERIGGNDPMWPWTGPGQAVTPNNVWDYRNLGYVYDTLWPVPPWTDRVPGTPVPVGPQWASIMFGPGWTLTEGGFDQSAQAVTAGYYGGSYGLGARGPAVAASAFAVSAGDAPSSGGQMGMIYLCLRGPGAAAQHPVLQITDGQQHFFRTWNGSLFVDNPSGKAQVVPAPNGDCWFQLHPTPASSGDWNLAVQQGLTQPQPFTAWAMLTPV